jgi:hypothetical protein
LREFWYSDNPQLRKIYVKLDPCPTNVKSHSENRVGGGWGPTITALRDVTTRATGATTVTPKFSDTLPQVIYSSHYGNGAPTMFT